MTSLIGPPPVAVLLLAVSALILDAPGLADQSEPGADPWFAAHAFVGEHGCLAVGQQGRLNQGDPVLIFEAGNPVKASRVTSVLSGDSAKRIYDERRFDAVYHDKALWDSVGCYWGMRAYERPFWLARCRAHDRTSFSGYVLAIDGLPVTALSVGANGAPLTAKELGALQGRIRGSAPEEFSRVGVLRVGYRYSLGPRHELTELLLGKASYSPDDVGAQIDSIEVCRVLLHNGRVLTVERFSRASGEEERVDVEPPQLSENNWHEFSESTLGFISVDDAKTWNRLSVDVGFEGIHWAVTRLTGTAPQIWDFYLYTYH